MNIKIIHDVKNDASINTVAVYSHGNLIRNLIKKSGIPLYNTYIHRVATDGTMIEYTFKQKFNNTDCIIVEFNINYF